MRRPRDPNYPLVLSYRALRTFVGLIGILLPFALIIGKWVFDGPGILSSISSYYWTSMRDVFVGSMWAAGVFLIAYRFDRWDDIVADFAGFAAILLALFPTPPEGRISDHQRWIGYAHSVTSAVFFIGLTLFALFLFQRPDPGEEGTKGMHARNIICRVCGSIMAACLVLMFSSLLLQIFLQDPQWLRSLNPGFSLETLALLAFGVAWFVKGGLLQRILRILKRLAGKQTNAPLPQPSR